MVTTILPAKDESMLVIEELLPGSLQGRDRNFVVAVQDDEIVGAGCIDLLPSRIMETGLGIQIATRPSADRKTARTSLVESLCRTAASWGAGRVFLTGWATDTGPSARAKRNLGFQPFANMSGWSLKLDEVIEDPDDEMTERTLTRIQHPEVPRLLDELGVSSAVTRKWFIQRSRLVKNPVFLLRDAEGTCGLIGFTLKRRNASFRLCWREGRQVTDSDARLMIGQCARLLSAVGVKRMVASAPTSKDSPEISALIAAGGTKHGDRCLWVRPIVPEIRSA